MKNKKRFLSKLVIGTALTVLLPALAHADSLWLDGTSRPMFVDKRAVNVGDIVTIMVQENSSANKNNSTTSERQSSLSAAITSFLYSPAASGLLTKGGQLPALA
jgi:flagellar basal body L-ring protein FlgH